MCVLQLPASYHVLCIYLYIIFMHRRTIRSCPQFVETLRKENYFKSEAVVSKSVYLHL